MTDKCRSCDAEIIWCFTSGLNRMPVDAHPVAGGQIRITRPSGVPVATVVGAAIDLFDDTDDGDRHTSHFATCPNAEEWRSKR